MIAFGYADILQVIPTGRPISAPIISSGVKTFGESEIYHYNFISRIIPIIFFYTKWKSYRRACVDITATPPYV